jgi:hypothetical protein
VPYLFVNSIYVSFCFLVVRGPTDIVLDEFEMEVKARIGTGDAPTNFHC